MNNETLTEDGSRVSVARAW